MPKPFNNGHNVSIDYIQISLPVCNYFYYRLLEFLFPKFNVYLLCIFKKYCLRTLPPKKKKKNV